MANGSDRKVHFDTTVFVGIAPQYDRKIRAHWLTLTIKDKLRIRAEMNIYKATEMQIHPESSNFTHFTPVQPSEPTPSNQRLSADAQPNNLHLNLAKQLTVSQPRDSPSAIIRHEKHAKPNARSSQPHSTHDYSLNPVFAAMGGRNKGSIGRRITPSSKPAQITSASRESESAIAAAARRITPAAKEHHHRRITPHSKPKTSDVKGTLM